MNTIRSLLDRLPTPLKVALWLAASGAIAQLIANSSALDMDPALLAIVNFALVTARELLDRWKPTAKLTGATP